MKYVSILFVCLAYVHFVHGQKQIIDTTTFGKWPSVDFLKITKNGAYFSYRIINEPVGKSTLVLGSVNSSALATYVDGVDLNFSDDSKYAFFKKNDSLHVLNLESNQKEICSHVLTFKNSKSYLGYLLNNKELIIHNFDTGKEIRFFSVVNFEFDENGKSLVVIHDSNIDSSKEQQQIINLFDLANCKMIQIWNGTMVYRFCFNSKGKEFVFTAGHRIRDRTINSIWHYRIGSERARMILNDYSVGIDSGLMINVYSKLRFSKKDDNIFFSLRPIPNAEAKSNYSKVDVWSYKDAKLQSEQLNELAPRIYNSVFRLTDSSVFRIEQDNENIISFDYQINDDYFLLSKVEGDNYEWNWNLKSRPSIYLISIRTGLKRCIREMAKEYLSEFGLINSYAISPNGEYAIYYDPKEKSYYSYSIKDRTIQNITKGVSAIWTTLNQDDIPMASYIPRGIACWAEDGGLFIYSQRDIFKIDPKGFHQPINVTNNYGQRHNIVFQFAKNHSNEIISKSEKLLLSAVSQDNFKRGFFKKDINNSGDPLCLTMDKYQYVLNNVLTKKGLYSQDSNMYFVMRMSTSESPNYFITSDFKSYRSLSNIYPERNYNWVNSELLTWKAFDGKISHGVLYRPDNFTSKKKYPVIFLYYERYADQFNNYFPPGVSSDEINIPWFVSNGYLVFTPDIRFKIGFPGGSVVNSVVSAAKYLSKYLWVNSKKMGIQGHSFGGYETNFLVTHTNMFAAACSGAGTIDFISSYGALRGNGRCNQHIYETTQSRVGRTLWERPDLYIKNSPIFFVNKVSTPILLLHNKKDGQVPFSQSIEFFTALRRLHKKAWLLQYDDGRHSVFGQDAVDFTIRLTQFYNYYLKDLPAPKWMLDGIPAKMKGIDDGLGLSREVDPTGKPMSPGPGLLLPEEQLKVDALMRRKFKAFKLE